MQMRPKCYVKIVYKLILLEQRIQQRAITKRLI